MFNRIQIWLIGVIAVGALTLGSCNFVDYELNQDPNKPSDVSQELLLPGAQITLGYVLGGDIGRYTSCWTQHHAGVDRQHADYSLYRITETDVNTLWNNLYATTLSDLDIIIQKSADDSSPHYSGVAKIMTANTLGILTDLYGDIPYSDALQNGENLTPTYDTGESIYVAIQQLLDEGISEVTAVGSSKSPGSDDLIYGGDLSAWVAAANSLKARYHIHLSELNASTAYTNALAAINAGAISSNAGDAEVPFGAAATEANPWFQFEQQRSDVDMGEFFIDLMNSIADPRVTVFASPNQGGAYVGAPQGVAGVDASPFGPAYGSSASPVPLISYVETKFIEAEANLGTDNAAAAAAHNEAIIASLAKFGVSDATYEAAQADETGASINLTKIITHKYIALYTQLETYNDLRRTDNLVGITSATTGTSNIDDIPSRFPYPLSERLSNGANRPSGVTLNDNVHWDQ